MRLVSIAVLGACALLLLGLGNPSDTERDTPVTERDDVTEENGRSSGGQVVGTVPGSESAYDREGWDKFHAEFGSNCHDEMALAIADQEAGLYHTENTRRLAACQGALNRLIK